MSSPVQPGDVLAGKYRVERVLGVGGMGVVVAATHLHLDQPVALKFMLPAVLGNREAVTRFLREARAAVRLKGEHIARVLDVGTLDNEAPYIVMEYLDGDDLGGTLEKRGALPIEEACTYVLQACEAMAEAHAQAIVHRDLKPQNLFLAKRPDGTPCVKVLDFGISKASFAVGEQGVEMTHTAAIMGSPAYMSPEQMKSSKDVDARTDIWALGVILYQLVTARMPFRATTMAELCVQILHDEPEPLRVIRPDVPPAYETVVARCLVKDREHRYGNIADLVADLAPLVPKSGAETLERVSRLLKVVPRAPTAPPAGRFATAPDAPTIGPGWKPGTTLGAAAGASVSEHRPASRRGVALAIAAVVAIAGVIVFVMTRSAEPSSRDQPPAEPAAATVPEPPADARPAVVPTAPDAGVATAAVPAIDAGVAPPPAVTAETKTSRKSKDRDKKPAPAVDVKQPEPDPVKKPDPEPDPPPLEPEEPAPDWMDNRN